MNKIIFDWLSFTSNVYTPQDIIKFLGFQKLPFKETSGAKGYKKRLYYDCVSIHFDGQTGGIWVELSGQGCRVFETFGTGDYDSLFGLIIANQDCMNITRLDLAFDDFEELLNIDKICYDVVNQNYVSKFNAWECIQTNKGNSVLLGSRTSECLIRIYDKAKERGFEDARHWIRIEFQLRRERALEFITKYQNNDIGYLFNGILNNYVRFVEPSETDTNKNRWETAEYWQKLLEHSKQISIYEKPGTEYNLYNLERYCLKQAGNAVDAYIQIRGVDGFLKDLEKRGTMENPKYTDLIEKCKREV